MISHVCVYLNSTCEHLISLTDRLKSNQLTRLSRDYLHSLPPLSFRFYLYHTLPRTIPPTDAASTRSPSHTYGRVSTFSSPHMAHLTAPKRHSFPCSALNFPNHERTRICQRDHSSSAQPAVCCMQWQRLRARANASAYRPLHTSMRL
jgi:hypothetical protein